MALPFVESGFGDGSFQAALTTGERLFLVRAVADILELLGDADEPTEILDPLEQLSRQLDIDTSDFEAFDLNPTQAKHPWEENEEVDASQLEAVLNGLANHDEPLAPIDPAIRRLLPDASLDPDVAAEFRRYTDDNLREQKAQRLLLLSERLTDVEPSSDDDEHIEFFVDADEAEAFAGAFGDIRLVLGERLDLRTDSDSEKLEDDVMEIAQQAAAHEDGLEGLDIELERKYVMGILFELAGFLQESITQCMLRELRRKRSHQ